MLEKKIHHLVFSTSSKNKSNKNSVIKLWSGAQNSGRHLLRAHLRPWDFTQPSFLSFFFFFFCIPILAPRWMESSSETAARRSEATKKKKKTPFQQGSDWFHCTFYRVLTSVSWAALLEEAGRRPALASVRFLLKRLVWGAADESSSLSKEARLIDSPCPTRCSVAAPHLETASPPPTATPCTKAASQDPNNNNSHNNNDNNNDRTDTVGAAWAGTCHFWRSG